MAQAWILDDAHTKAHVFSDLQSKLSYAFCNLNLLERCFLAEDTNSADREGHRGLAQLGDSLMGFIVMSDGTERNLPRAVLQASSSGVRSKEHCGRIAKVLRLDQWLKLSERQIHNGVQPTTLKNVVAALVGAVWLDSHSYLAVVKVMIQMGLLNNAHHHDQQQAAAQDHEARNSDYWSLLPESDRTVPDAIQLRSPNSHDSPIQMMKSYNPPGECFQADLLTNADRREQFLSGCNDWHSPTQSPGAVSMQMASLESSSMQGISPSNDNGCPTSRVQLPLSESRELDTPDKQQGSANTESIMGSSSSMQELDSDEVEGTHQISSTPLLSATSQNPSGTRKRNYGGVRKPPGRKDNRKTPGRPKADNPATLIENYISSEDKKVHDAQRRAMVFAAMRTYQAMILKVRGNGKAGLAALAISVGDSSALSILKAAVQGLRSQTISDIIRIDIAMTISERLRLINRTGCCIELLRLMRNYHTVALWRDITTTERGGVDAFVVSTPESIASEVPRAGNPLHIMKAHVSQGMTSFGNAMEGAETPCIGRRLRKLGERLDRLVRAWGEGVLLLLGQTLTETRLLEPRDGDYDRLVELMDVSEGARIREISHVAERILQYFRTESSQVARLVLENTDDEILREIPRLSHDFVDLLRPLAGDSRLSSCSHL